ncbi:GNAT family N-acetyltransferase [Paenibacillus dendritiformis]|uniref:GNAT family N-acetyltransferase n=1 Tax=Paenibacillus dendritiformis TaxID=130049 RepID=UPI000DA9566E|nr:GNAT family N-acetyltransferase [Paenibacillus dendritiformis]PZM61907.1 GNAT family N-acetyltransferase [Paenibacillus dendritiformis]
MIRIAPVTADQLEELAALYTELEGNVTNRERLREKFALLQDHPDYLLLGAVHESGRLVGSVMGITCQDLTGNCRPFMVLENMIVTEAFHRSGIGQMLVQTVEQAAQERGCHSVMLFSSTGRNDAHRFYEKLGFLKDAAYGFVKPL